MNRSVFVVKVVRKRRRSIPVRVVTLVAAEGEFPEDWRGLIELVGIERERG